MGQLQIGSSIIDYEEKYSAKAKKIRITIVKDKVTVTIPKGVHIEDVRKFVESKQDWIFKHVQAYHISETKALPPKEYVAGEKYPYMGRELLLRTMAYDDSCVTIKLETNIIWIFIPKSALKESWPRLVKEALIYSYKTQVQKIFKEKLDMLSKMMGVKYNELHIKEQRTRWGSCSRKGNINLNWRIIMAPNQVIDYLLIHELAHLKHLNHSKAFWHFLASFMPDYKKWEKWLKENGKELMALYK